MDKKVNSYNNLCDQMIAEMEAATCSWWDITVIAYAHLEKGLEAISVREAEFIRNYGEKEYSDRWIYSEAYKRFKKILSASPKRYDLVYSDKASVIQEFKKIRTILSAAYDHLTFLSCIYSFLKCIDLSVDDWIGVWDEKEVGPLNGNIDYGFALYLRGEKMLTSAAKECSFYNQDLQMSFRTTLPHLIFWPVNTDLRGILIPLPTAPFFKETFNREARNSSLDVTLRIAVLPVDCTLTGSANNNVQPFLRMHKRTESSVYWEYVPEGQERITAKVMRDLENVINWDPHIIIFPEYCIGEKQLVAIKEYLLENKKTLSTKNLKFIVAGTTYETVENENGSFEHDNVCHVITPSCTWRSYKAEEYCDVIGEVKNKNELKDFTNVEILSHPAKELVIPYIKNVGYVQIPICRDVINSENTESVTGLVAERISPTLILVPAWSKSHDRFIKPLDRFVGLYYSCAVLCNSCTAAQDTRIGFVGVPQRYQTIHDMYMKEVTIERDVCRENCANRNESCIFMAKITNKANHTRDSIVFSFSRV